MATLEVVREAAGPMTWLPGGGLRGALLGGWAEPATHGCGGLAASGGGNLAAATILTTHPCPPIPFDACGWPISAGVDAAAG